MQITDALRAVLCALLGVTLTSCNREPKRPPLHAVSGTVTFQKGPAPGAVVVFRPITPGLLKNTLPHGEVGPDGTFRIGTYELGDGAPEGEYVITISWPEVKPEPGGGESIGGDRLNGRFSDPTNSTLKIQVKQGSNELEPIRVD